MGDADESLVIDPSAAKIGDFLPSIVLTSSLSVDETMLNI